MKRECKKWSPLSNCNRMHLTCASENGACILSSKEARSCSQYSITRNVLSNALPTATSRSSTILSCRKFSRTWISRNADTDIPSVLSSVRTFFNATIYNSPIRASFSLLSIVDCTFPLLVSFALYTIPYVPSPTRFNFSNSFTDRHAPKFKTCQNTVEFRLSSTKCIKRIPLLEWTFVRRWGSTRIRSPPSDRESWCLVVHRSSTGIQRQYCYECSWWWWTAVL